VKFVTLSCAHYSLLFILTYLTTTVGIAQIAFTKHTIDGNYDGAGSVYATYVDGDTLVDVICSGLVANSIAWWKNDGGNPINWAKHTITNDFQTACWIYATDIDGDNNNDVVGSAWTGDEIAWWKNEGGNPVQWSKQTVGANFDGPDGVYASDIDNDGDVDVLGAAMMGNQIALWYNDGQHPVTWTKRVIDGSFGWARSVYAEDVNGDSLIDILGAAYTANTIAVWYNNGDSTWTKQIVDNSFGGAHRVYACDVDKDNDIDVLGAAYLGDEIAWWRNDGGNPIQWTKQTIGENFDGAICVYTCDIDNDNDIDVLGVAEFSGKVALWLNKGGNPINWVKQTISDNFAGAWSVYAEDINKDGKSDILSGASGADDLVWWENEGILDVGDNLITPHNYKLEQNYPNPFNPETRIKYQIPIPGFVSLKVYDVLGNEISTLVNEEKSEGEFEVQFNATGLSSGIYFYQIQAENIIKTKKMMLIK